jgi:hypothetical protein
MGKVYGLTFVALATIEPTRADAHVDRVAITHCEEQDR